jgi:hypothetical protein
MYVKPAKGSKTSCKNISKSMKVSTPDDANFLKRHYCRVIFLTTTLIVFLFAFIGPVNGAGHIDPEADKILRSMSDYLKGLPRFSVNIDIDTEVIDLAGQNCRSVVPVRLFLNDPATCM